MTLRPAFIFPALLIALLLASGHLRADCANPAGERGLAIFNSDHGVMQFCDGTNWISMAASGLGTEVDPKVGTLTNGKWCSSNGSIITCTENAPVGAAGGSSGQIQYNNGGAFGGAAAVTYATSGDLFMITAQAATDKPLVIKGAESQSGALTEWRNSSDVLLSSVTSNGSLNIGGGLGVTGATILSSTLGVSGAVTLNSTLGVTGATTINGTLTVVPGANSSSLGLTQYSTTNQVTLTVPSYLRISGGLVPNASTGTLGGGSNKWNLTAASVVADSINVSGAASLGNTLDVTGAVTAASFSGSGASLTSIPVSAISATGTADASTWLRGDGAWTTVSSSQWTTTGSDIYYNTGNVGIGTASPSSKAVLDLTSTTKGFLPPRMTKAQRNAISSPSAGLMIYQTDDNRIEWYDGSYWMTFSGGTAFADRIVATGGTITDISGYRVHTFTSSNTFQITSGAGTVEYLVVAGGGGGGSAIGGGGGGGGVVTGSFTRGTNSYTVTVGAGGAGATGGAGNGGNSAFDTVTAIGGGGGGGSSSGQNGGSGGGAGTCGGCSYTYGTGTSGQGNNGGTSTGAANYGTGGGGGASGVGGNGSTAASGSGGAGVVSSISGSSVTYGGGGGGGGGLGASAGSGGSGGGGNGATSTVGGNGTANTGGGGGGGGWTSGGWFSGGSGGSGIVIVRYAYP